MKCQSCKVKINSSFAFAIKNNQCPACGNSIMDSKKLASYLSLQSLLDNNFSDIDTEKVVNLIVANFEIKQLFKEELTNGHVDDIVEVNEEMSGDDNNEGEVSDPDVASDEEYKKRQMADAKETLKKLREEALNEATAEHWGLGEADGLVNPATLSVEEKLKYDKQQRAENISSGTRGAFRRG